MGEEVDIEQPAALIAYLRQTGRVAPEESPAVRVLAGGVSNKTVLVERPSGEAWVLKQALPKLRVKVDWFSDPARIGREALALRWLPKLAPEGAVTPLVFEDPANHLLAMAAVPQPHENWKTMLLAGRVDMEHVEQFGALLGTIYRRAAPRRRELADAFGDRSFFESLRLEPYYEYSARNVPGAADFLRDLAAETRGRRQALVHGDYSPKNVLVHGGRLVLLDHEVMHFGDPAFDVGFALAHLLSKAHHLPDLRKTFARAAGIFWLSYLRRVGPVPWASDLSFFSVRHTLGCLMARVAGRSPLEYLTEPQRRRQEEVVLLLMGRRPNSLPELIDRFTSEIGKT